MLRSTTLWRAPSRNSWERQRRGSKIHLLANPGQNVAPIGAARQKDTQMQLGSLQYPHNPVEGGTVEDSTSAESRTTWEARTRTFWISKWCSVWRPAFLDHSAVVASANSILSPGSAAAAASSPQRRMFSRSWRPRCGRSS